MGFKGEITGERVSPACPPARYGGESSTKNEKGVRNRAQGVGDTNRTYAGDQSTSPPNRANSDSKGRTARGSSGNRPDSRNGIRNCPGQRLPPS